MSYPETKTYPVNAQSAPQQVPQTTGHTDTSTSSSPPLAHQTSIPINSAPVDPPQYTTDPEKGSYQNHQAQSEPQQAYQNGTPQQAFQQQPNQALPQEGKSRYQTAVPLSSLSSAPAPVDCPFCGTREMTNTEFVSGSTTHIGALVLCCCFCLGCIPYIGRWAKDCEHKCGHCGGLLAVWHRSERTEVIAHGRQ